ncbi:MAG: tryptophan-rich sensory protein [Candidatus Levybacteria bacterium]|nr:tryptophan-rich sensory protein [Candidatus Levybacteria bacterium]
MQKLGKLIFSIVLPFMAAAVGSLFTVSSIPTWYATLYKPFFSPPNWIFGPVWTLLYLLMGISFYLVWVSKKKKKKSAYKYYFVQLMLNALWSIVFFGMHQLVLSLIVIVLLLYFIFKTITSFGKIDKLAGQFLYPYIVWVSFATVLNLSIVLLNRSY